MSSRRTRVPQAVRFAPRLESLEARDVPAGNVQAFVGDGILYVAGDDAANRFSIFGTGKNSVALRSLDGTTTINGRSDTVFIGDIKRGYYIRTYGGDDVVVISGTRSNGMLDVDTGDGNDDLRVSDAGHRKETVLATGNGNDTVTLNGSWFRRPVYINTGAGDDRVIANRIGAKDFLATNPAGTDTFENRNSILGSTTIRGFNTAPPPVTPPTPPTPDTTSPTASVTAPATPTRTAPLAFAVMFDEAVTGFSAAGLTVTNGTAAGVDANSDRSFTVRVTPTGQGAVSVRVNAGAATDAAGNPNAASSAASATFDSVAPVLAINAQTTNNNKPLITGTVDDPAAAVTVVVNGQTLTATVTGTTWAAQVTAATADGTYPVTATATDPAGNSASTTLAAGLVVDTAAPAVPTFNLDAAFDSGMVGDLRTDNDTVTFTGTAEAGARVRLFRATSGTAPGSGTLVAETTATTAGAFTFANVALAVGPNSFAARAVDAAGNLGPTLAQTFTRNTAPTVATAIADQNLTVAGGAQTFNLTTTFADAERVVRLTTTYPGGTGNIDINLFPDQAPNNVANFIAYATSSDPTQTYDGSVFHRLAPGFVLQGGGFMFDDNGTTTATAFPTITKLAPVANEPGVSNTRGTVAFAKGVGPDSATSEFFFNLADNAANLDTQNGGFTVFGQVMNGGQQTVDAIATLATFGGPGLPGAPPFPVRAGADTTDFPANINAADLAFVTTAAELEAVQRLAFTATSSDITVATAMVANGMLTVTPLVAGMTTITVTATDLDGSATMTTFMVTVS